MLGHHALGEHPLGGFESDSDLIVVTVDHATATFTAQNVDSVFSGEISTVALYATATFTVSER